MVLKQLRCTCNILSDLVIMDITMPGMSGIDALKKIMKINPKAKVILCTAIGGQKDIIIEGLKKWSKRYYR